MAKTKKKKKNINRIRHNNEEKTKKRERRKLSRKKDRDWYLMKERDKRRKELGLCPGDDAPPESLE